MFQQEEKVQIARREADRAIQLAMASRWEEAVAANRAIINLSPNDADSYNRLGKALMELGRHSEAKKAYKKTLELDATNQIARKNLDRMIALAKSGGAKADTAQMDPSIFIEETGKSTITMLQATASSVLATLKAGDRVELHPTGNSLAIETAGGEFVGAVEPKLGIRLIKLIDGGNQYAAAVTSLNADECRIIIKETYQDPGQIGRPSFPAASASESTRPYTKESLLRRDTKAEAPRRADSGDDGDEDGWDTESERQDGDVRLSDAAAAEDADDDELEE
ncbi:MAG: tetratricopeptide repeat protein [Chloroflexi bacterium]|nr:tetratricopeptide repeat protein [Chloroflexota bacterium]